MFEQNLLHHHTRAQLSLSHIHTNEIVLFVDDFRRYSIPPRAGHTLSSSILILEFIWVFFFVRVPVFINCILWEGSNGWFSGIWFVDKVFTLAFESFGGGGGLGKVAVLFCGRSANSGGGSWWWEWWCPRIVAGSPLTPGNKQTYFNPVWF